MVNSSFIYPVPPGHLPVSRPGAVFAARNHPSPTSGARPQNLYRTLPVGAPVAAMLAAAS